MSQNGNDEHRTVHYLNVKAAEQPLHFSVGRTGYTMLCVGDVLSVSHFEDLRDDEAAALQAAVDDGYLMRFDTYAELQVETMRRSYTYTEPWRAQQTTVDL